MNGEAVLRIGISLLTHIFLVVHQQQHGSVFLVVERQLHNLIELVGQLHVADDLASVWVQVAQEAT